MWRSEMMERKGSEFGEPRVAVFFLKRPSLLHSLLRELKRNRFQFTVITKEVPDGDPACPQLLIHSASSLVGVWRFLRRGNFELILTFSFPDRLLGVLTRPRSRTMIVNWDADSNTKRPFVVELVDRVILKRVDIVIASSQKELHKYIFRKRRSAKTIKELTFDGAGDLGQMSRHFVEYLCSLTRVRRPGDSLFPEYLRRPEVIPMKKGTVRTPYFVRDGSCFYKMRQCSSDAEAREKEEIIRKLDHLDILPTFYGRDGQYLLFEFIRGLHTERKHGPEIFRRLGESMATIHSVSLDDHDCEQIRKSSDRVFLGHLENLNRYGVISSRQYLLLRDLYQSIYPEVVPVGIDCVDIQFHNCLLNDDNIYIVDEVSLVKGLLGTGLGRIFLFLMKSNSEKYSFIGGYSTIRSLDFFLENQRFYELYFLILQLAENKIAPHLMYNLLQLISKKDSISYILPRIPLVATNMLWKGFHPGRNKFVLSKHVLGTSL
jgi:hypothetical protein